MSNYQKLTKHPEYQTWEKADWIDNHFGEHNYGVIFPSHPNVVFDPRDEMLETREEYFTLETICSKCGGKLEKPRRKIHVPNICQKCQRLKILRQQKEKRLATNKHK